MVRCVIAAVLISLAGISAPAQADEYYAVTPTGGAETMFAGSSGETISKLANQCLNQQWSIASSSATEIVCEAPLNMGQSVLGQALLGNSYSTPPRRFFKFSAIETAGVSRVKAGGWMELQMAFGQVRRTELSGPEFHNGIMNVMENCGGQLPLGTTFPNHVMLGISISPAMHGKYGALQVNSLFPGAPAERAGVKPGDLVVKIAGATFKNQSQYYDALSKAAKTNQYPIEVIRAGKSMRMTLDRTYRPAITEIVSASAAKPPNAVQPTSIADELTKFAKLRDEGVLSESEFQEQKRKLLDR